MKGSQARNTTFIQLPRTGKAGILLLCLLLFSFPVSGQEVRIEADSVPLNIVLLRMAEQYGIQISFDDRLLSEYPVTVHRHFGTAEEAIGFLLEPLPLVSEKNGEVFVIFGQPVRQKTYLVSGRIVDLRSGESLPYAHLVIGRQGLITDFSGHFSFTSLHGPPYSLSFSHLGYYILDTVLQTGTGHVIGLEPSIYQLEEVTVQGSPVDRSGQAGEEAGVMRLNHKIAYRLPGNGDDALFNFLRLQPGILAAGEQSSEMIIWAGYPGQGQLLFDGFTIFGPKNFNDNISFVNPYMAKDIRVLKGGYAAEYGDRVGGIVEISGIQGSRSKPAVNLNINHMTVSGMGGVPLGENAAMTLAFRHTYYNLYDDWEPGTGSDRERGDPGRVADITASPDYRFRDANLKLAGSTGSGDPWYVSLYNGGDHFSYRVDEERNVISISQDMSERSGQLGGTAYYGRTWKKGVRSNFYLSYSGLDREISESQETFHKIRQFTISRIGTSYHNTIAEVNLRTTNHIPLSGKHRMITGAGFVHDRTGFLRESLGSATSENRHETGRVNLFLCDRYEFTPAISLKPGIRFDFPLEMKRLYAQPRLQLSADISGDLRVNAAWGIYNQFITETSVLDEYGNYRFFWTACDNESVPVLSSQHYVGGLVFHRGGFTFSMESFYKTVEGITRMVDQDGGALEAYRGRARIYGADLLVRQYFGKHEGWVSYTLGRAREHFPYFIGDDYRDAPQDQRHEVKGALLLDLKPFYLTINYVYGSGLAYLSASTGGSTGRYPYSRLDAALIYRTRIRKVRVEAGISALNIFNRENIKYANLVKIPDGAFSTLSVHAEAVPFTPTIYLNVAF